jgi:hypothetical protein
MSELLINLSIYNLPPDSIDFFSLLPAQTMTGSCRKEQHILSPVKKPIA